MAAKIKKKLYREAMRSDYVFQPNYEELKENFHLKGKWKIDYFNNENNIILELACGKAEYSVALAKKYPNINFIGIDIKGDRLVRGARKAEGLGLKNIAFIRTRIENLSYLFEENEIIEIWIVFPDPLSKKSKIKKRLTNPRFLNIYKKILNNNGIIHLKTDDIPFFEYSIATLQQFGFKIINSEKDIYKKPLDQNALKIQTYYEKKWLTEGRKIQYLKCIVP